MRTPMRTIFKFRLIIPQSRFAISMLLSTSLLLLAVLLLSGLLFGGATVASAQVGASSVDQADSIDQPDIVGGRESDEGAWPWQVALVDKYYENAHSGQFCGGTLIAPQWVLTAGHCVTNLNDASFLDVVIGRHRLSSDQGQRLAVNEIHIHPEYNGSLRDPDLALLYLSEPVTYTPVAIDTSGVLSAEERSLSGMVVGWGRYSQSSYQGSDVLREVTVPVHPLAVCRTAFSYYLAEYITDDQICVGYGKGAKGVCHGDSGGPLLIPSDDGTGWVQVGITNWGNGYCYSDYFSDNYSLFARISSFQPWIQSCMANQKSKECRGGDGYEPDDDFGSAALISTDGLSQTHTFHYAGDVDWLKFEATAGKIYIFETFDLDYNTDTILWLYGTDGRHAIIYQDDNYSDYYSSDRASTIRWKATNSGTYFLAVENHWRSGTLQRAYHIRGNEYEHEMFLPVISSQTNVNVPIAIVTAIAVVVTPATTPTPDGSNILPMPTATPTP